MLLALVLVAWVTYADRASEIEQITGSRTKVVWARSITGICERDVTTANYALMGFDTYTGNRHEIVAGPVNCANPWITPDGRRVVYSDWPANEVHIVDWTGQNRRHLLSGFGLAVWADPKTGVEWVYVSDKAYGSSVHRYQIDDPEQSELVWDKTGVSIRFRVSADGTRAGGEFPWSSAGVITLPNGTFTKYSSGCNSMLAPDNSYRFFHMKGTHREIFMYDSGGLNQRKIMLNTAPGIDDASVWIPKWSSDARFLTISGPESVPDSKNDIYLGAFNEDFTDIVAWTRVTDTPDTIEIYAYAWLGPEPCIEFVPARVGFCVDSGQAGTLSERVAVTVHDGQAGGLTAQTGALWLTLDPGEDETGPYLDCIADPQGLAPGVYAASVVVTSGSFSEDYVVALEIGGPLRLSGVCVLPAEAYVPCSSSLQLRASGYDQFGDLFETAVEWSVSIGGFVSDSGLFTSDGTAGEFMVTARSSPDTSVLAKATVCVYRDVRVKEPHEGDVYSVGDTLWIAWDADTIAVRSVSIEVSLDNGRSWVLLNPEKTVNRGEPEWGHYWWVIPDSVSAAGSGVVTPAISTSCLARVSKYSDPSISGKSEGLFTIAGTSHTMPWRTQASGSVRSFRIRVHNGVPVVEFSEALPEYCIEVYDMAGRIVACSAGAPCARFTLRDLRLGQGTYIVRVIGGPHVLWARLHLYR